MFQFLLTSILLGVGLAMDACAVSMTDGFFEPEMKIGKSAFISSMFGLFQGFMPLIGYLLGSLVVSFIERFIPWIALILLAFLGGKMLFEAFHSKGEDDKKPATSIKTIFVQSFATSIDALSVGITIASYTLTRALICSAIVAIITFLISFASIFIGKKFGTKLGKKAEIFGGFILILIGVEIFVTGMLGI